MVIDDEEIIIKSLTKLLEKNGFTVFVARSGRDALVIADEEKFDLIISDIRIPGMNGVEVVKGIYEILQKKGLEKPPGIFITGYADEKSEQAAADLNPVAYIYKPFDIAELVKMVKEAFK